MNKLIALLSLFVISTSVFGFEVTFKQSPPLETHVVSTDLESEEMQLNMNDLELPFALYGRTYIVKEDGTVEFQN